MSSKGVLDKHIITKVRSYIRKLKAEGLRIDQAIVFGSYAKGKQKPWSDIDVGVVSRNFGKDYHEELVALLTLRGNKFLDIEPHPFKKKSLNDPFDSLAQEVKKYGIRIV